MMQKPLITWSLLVVPLLLISTSQLPFSLSSYSLPIAEYDSLYDLYNSTEGPNWSWKEPYSVFGNPWYFTVPPENPCSSTKLWQGISCTSNCGSSQCHITSISLGNNNMRGTLPESLGNFSTEYFETLSITGNTFLRGTIPGTLGKLTGLRSIYFYKNHLEGSIPEYVGNWIKLQNIDLDSNELIGSIPPEFGQILTLQQLILFKNKLTGSIPPTIENIFSLQQLSLHSNKLTGTIPSGLGNLYNVYEFALNQNFLTGTIPTSLGNLAHLSSLFLDSNILHGTIPPSLGNLISSTTFQISSNELSGTIPNTLGNMTLTQTLELNSNKLTGTIPTSLDRLFELEIIQLCDNHLTGTLPSTLDKLTRLQNLVLFNNIFAGTIPSEYGQLFNLQYLQLYGNILTGAIPPALHNLGKLGYLQLNDNLLTGTIPSVFGNMVKLLLLNLYSNQLVGTIPSTLSGLVSLEYLDVDSNQLSGTIPPELGSLSELQLLSLYGNDLTGTIPIVFGNLTSLEYIDVDSNRLTGSIPFTLQYLHKLQYCALFNNQLSGTIPSIWRNLTRLQYLDVHNNQLTGTIPASLEGLITLQYLALYNNHLSGTIPITILSRMPALQAFEVYNNSLVGSINLECDTLMKAFDVSYNALTGQLPSTLFAKSMSLKSINVNDNHFSGSVPGEWFMNKTQLTSVVMGSNCFSGTLSESICSSPSLSQLILDGLHSSSSCIYQAFPFLPQSGKVIRNGVYGTIPSCLFNMKNLSVLHLGGNLLSGMLPNLPSGHQLKQLVLSSNALTGEVPSNIWLSNLTKLDLSFNRLKGTLPSNMLRMAISSSQSATSSVLTLHVNQLSGTVPSSLLSFPANTINILEGNLFSCNIARSDIPQNDPKYTAYNCGSDPTNRSLVAFSVVSGLAIVLFISYATSLTKPLMMWRRSSIDNGNDDSNRLLLRIRYICMLMVMGCLCGLLIFWLLSLSSSSYNHSYVWSISAIYKSGFIASLTMLVWFLIIACVIIGTLMYLFNHLAATTITAKITDNEQSLLHRTAKHYSWSTTLAIAINITVVVIVNGLYVSAVRSNFDTIVLTLIALSLSVFKYAWGHVLVNSANYFSLQITDTTMITVSLFNNLVAPFVAELFVSADCFLYLVTKAPSLTFSYLEYGCVGGSIFGETIRTKIDCGVPQGTGDLNVYPPFHYSHQCSFTLISSYSSVIVYRYVLSSMLVPILRWVYVHTNGINSISSLSYHRTMLSALLLPSFWRISFISDAKKDPIALQTLDMELIRLEVTGVDTFRQRFLTNTVTSVALLFCFGVVFPPIALVIGISIYQDITDIEFVFGRYCVIMETISDEIIKERMLQLKDRAEKELVSCRRALIVGIWFGLCMSCGVWAFILYDTLSSSIGDNDSIWIAIIMVGSPYVILVIVWGILRWFDHYYFQSRRMSESTIGKYSIDETSSELISSTNNPLRESTKGRSSLVEFTSLSK